MRKLEIKRLTVKEYADSKDVTVSAVYKAIREGRVNFEKIGKVYLIIQ